MMRRSMLTFLAVALLQACDTSSKSAGDWVYVQAGANQGKTLTFVDRESGAPIEGVALFAYSIHDQLSLAGGHIGFDDRVHAEYRPVSNVDGEVDLSSFLGNAYLMKAFRTGYLPVHVRAVYMFGWGGPSEYFIAMDPAPSSLEEGNPWRAIVEGIDATAPGVGDYASRATALADYDALVLGLLTPDDVGVSLLNDGYPGWTSGPVEIASGNLVPADFRRMLKLRQDAMLSALAADDGTSLAIAMDYNEGVLLKEGGTTIALDLVQTMTHTIADGQLDQVDAFFVTHEHWDHFDGYLAKVANERGVPHHVPAVMLSSFADGVWELHNPTVLAGSTGLSGGDVVELAGWSVEAIETYHPRTGKHLSYLVTTPSNLRVLQLGDAANLGDFKVGGVLPDRFVGVDYVLAPIWLGALGLDDVVDTFSAKVLIPTHADEIGHVPADRYPYAIIGDMARQDRVEVLFPGEMVKSPGVAQGG